MNNLFRMRELIELINNADKAYFGEDKPIMTDKEYDALIENWNRKVSKRDTVIIVGDFAWERHGYFLNVLNGKKATCYPGICDDIKNAGAIYEDNKVVDKNYFSGLPSPGAAAAICAVVLVAPHLNISLKFLSTFLHCSHRLYNSP